jgi:hypothetical protein
MLFEIAKWFEFVSAFVVLLPFISLYYFLTIKSGKKHLQNDITIAAFYSIITAFIQTAVMLCALSGINNLWIFHAFISIELFFFTYILLYYSKEKASYLSLFLSVACYSIATTFDDPSKLPYLSVLIQFFSIMLTAPGAIMVSLSDKGSVDRKFYSYRDILIKAILITSISNFVFITFIEKHLILILFVHSTLNIYSNYLFARTYKCYSETSL